MIFGEGVSKLRDNNKILISNHLYQVGHDIELGYYLFSNEGTADTEHPDVYFNMYPERPPVSPYRRSSGYFGVTAINSTTMYVELKYGRALYYGKPFNLYETLRLAALPNDNYYPAGATVLQNELCTIKVYKQDNRTYLYHGDSDAEVYEQYLYSINGHKFWAGVLAIKSYKSHNGFAFGFVDSDRGRRYSFENSCRFAGTIYSSREDQIRLYQDKRGDFVEIELPPTIDLTHIELEWIQPKSNHTPWTERFTQSQQSIQEIYHNDLQKMKSILQGYCDVGIDIDISTEISNFCNAPDFLQPCADFLKNAFAKYISDMERKDIPNQTFKFYVRPTYDMKYYCASKLADEAESIEFDENENLYYVTLNSIPIKNIRLMYKNLVTAFNQEREDLVAAESFLHEYDSDTILCTSMALFEGSLQKEYGFYSFIGQSVVHNIGVVIRKSWTNQLTKLYAEMIKEKRVVTKWKEEYSLYTLVKQLIPEAEYQHRAEWLGQQSFDIFLPSQKIAIEYQGKQHYEAIKVFCGETSFENNKERDKKKRMKSAEHGVKIFDWKYDIPVNRANVKAFLDRHRILYDDSVTVSGAITGKQVHPMAPIIQQPVKAKATAPQVPRPSPFVIRQFDLDGKFVAEYPSVIVASEKCDVSERAIRKVLYNERKTGGGFMWQRCPRESKIENIAPVQYAENAGFTKKLSR